jgi:hypothetical protein
MKPFRLYMTVAVTCARRCELKFLRTAVTAKRLQRLLLLLSGVIFAGPASAHCVVGNRFFPATLIVDDPCVADELSMPTIAGFKNSDGSRELDVSSEFAKTITPNFGVSIEEDWIHLDMPGGGHESGFDNLGSSFQYQLLKDPDHELAMMASLDVDWGGTGSDAVGAESFTTLTPTLFVGKGFGFMPDSMKLLKPFALTAELGYQAPTQSSTTEIDAATGLPATENNPRSIVWGGTLQYSMPYLKSSVQDFGLPDFVNRLIPLVEANFDSEVSNFDGEQRTTGTVNPGLVYIGDNYQLSAEAIIPVNSASGDGVGVIGQFHLYLDDIFPHSIGKPLFGAANPAED